MKRFIAIIISLTLLISITGCSADALKVYRDAQKKTSEIKQGHLIYEVIAESKYNTEGLDEEEIKQLNYFGKVESKMDIVFKEDGENTEIISRNYFNLGGLGFDSAFYKDNEKMYIKTPILGKYVVLSNSIEGINESKDYNVENNNEKEFMEKIFTTIGEKWVQVLKEKDVVSGKKTLLSTEDGEVKATEFSITPSEGQIKELLKEVFTLLSTNEEFMKAAALGFKTDEEYELETEKILEELQNKIMDISIYDFKYTGYIDIDGYITQEDISFKVSNENAKPKEISESNVNIHKKTLSIEKEQVFDFPQLNEENTLELENLNQGMPFMLEGMFNKSEGGLN